MKKYPIKISHHEDSQTYKQEENITKDQTFVRSCQLKKHNRTIDFNNPNQHLYNGRRQPKQTITGT